MADEPNPLAPPPADPPTPPAGDPPTTPPIENQSQQPEGTAPWHTMVDEKGAFKEGAWDAFPVIEGEDAGKFQRLGAKTPDFETLVRNTVQLENLLSNEKLPLPKPEDGPEAWDRVYDALGRPEEAKYELPVGVEIPEDQKTPIDEVFHKNGVTQRQAEGLYRDIGAIMAQSAEGAQATDGDNVEKAVQSLEAEVGPRNTEGYTKALDQAEVVAKHLGLSDPALFKVEGFANKMASLHQTLIDSKMIGVQEATISQAQDLQTRITSIQTNPTDPLYHDYRASDWNPTREYVAKLTEELHAAKQADSM